MVTFQCSGDECKAGFPLKENTKEKVIKCPMEECGKETNIWLRLKRFQVGCLFALFSSPVELLQRS